MRAERVGHPLSRAVGALDNPVIRQVGVAVAKVVITLFVLVTVVFLITVALPANPARTALGRGATQEQIQEWNERQGLDRPVYEQYATWIGNLLTGDLGDSLISGRPVAGTVGPRLARSVILAVAAFAIALPLSIALGLYTGQRAGSRVDGIASGATLVIASIPEFLIGLALILIFAVGLGVLPVDSSELTYPTSFATKVEAYVLPVATAVLMTMPYTTRFVRSSTRDVVAEPYHRAAILRGIRGRKLTVRHVLPNALPPVLSPIALTFAELIGGLVVVEVVFGFPGVGQLLVESVASGDIPMVQALALLIGSFFVIVNLIADISILALSPRARTESK